MSYQSFSASASAFTFGYAIPAASLALRNWQCFSDSFRSDFEPLALQVGDVLVMSARGWGWALGCSYRIARRAWAEHGPLVTALVQIAGALLLLHISAQLGNQESDRLIRLELQKIWQFLRGRRVGAVSAPVVEPTLELPVVSVDEQPLTIADCGATVADYAAIPSQELRKLCTVKGVQWRNAKGKGKHLTKREMIAAIA